MLKIQEISTKKELKTFIDFVWKLYATDPNWVPPLRGQLRSTLLGKNNPLLRDRPHALYLARSGSKVVGRILVGINTKLNQEKGKNEGYISLFESVDQDEVAAALFTTAVNWLKVRGISRVVGPVSPTNGDDSRGILIKGFDGPPVLMNSYNRPYYQRLFEGYGFEKHMDLFAYYLKVDELNDARYGRVVEYAMKKFGFHIDRFDRKRLAREVRDLKQILDLAMPDTWEHLAPPAIEEIYSEFSQLKALLDPDLVYIARAGEEPIGFVVSLPDYNQVLKRLNGRLFPLGFIKFLWLKKRINGARIFMQFVVPRYRNKAVNGAIYHRLMLEAKRKGYVYGEGSTIAEMNKESIRCVEGVGGKLYRIYRIYRKDI